MPEARGRPSKRAYIKLVFTLPRHRPEERSKNLTLLPHQFVAPSPMIPAMRTADVAYGRNGRRIPENSRGGTERLVSRSSVVFDELELFARLPALANTNTKHERMPEEMPDATSASIYTRVNCTAYERGERFCYRATNSRR